VNIPVAKTVEDTEYKQLLKRHEMLEKLEKEDALIALQIQQESGLFLSAGCLKSEQELADEELAKRMQEQEIFYEDFVSHHPPTPQPSPAQALASSEQEHHQVSFY
jgi:hypothetical protein